MILRFFTLFLVSVSAVQAAQGEVLRGRPFYRLITSKDGLPHNNVRVITSDKRGYLWVGTQDGAAFYNGRVWTMVSLPNRTKSNDVFSLVSDSEGRIWFGTNGGGLSSLSRDGEWKTYDTTNSNITKNLVFSLLESRWPGKPFLWVGLYGGGLLKFIDGRFEQVKNGCLSGREVVLALYETGDTLWVGTATDGLIEVTGKSCRRHDASAGFPGTSVTSIMEVENPDKTRALHVGSGNGLAIYEKGVWRLLNPKNGFPAREVTAITVSTLPDGRTGALYGTQGDGLVYQDGSSWRVLDLDDGLPEGQINCLYDYRQSDGQRVAWMGTPKYGIVRLARGQWTSLSPFGDRTGDNILSMAETRSATGQMRYWIGSDRGLALYEDGLWTYFTNQNALSDNVIRVIIEAQRSGGRELLVGTNQGVNRYSAGRWDKIDVTAAGIHPEVRALLQTFDKDGASLWVGTFRGLGRLKNGKWQAFFEEDGVLPNNGVNCLLETRHGDGEPIVWAGTYGGGLAYYSKGSWGRYQLESNNVVLSLMEQKTPAGHYLWIGTHGGGVARLTLDAPNGSWLTLSDSTKPALLNNVVYQIKEDSSGRVYLFTNRGVSRLTPRTPTPDDSSPYAIYNFSTSDGLPSDKCNTSMVDSLGRVWAGTINGVAILDTAQEYEDRSAKRLYIEKVLLNGAILTQTERQNFSRDSLAYHQNALEFEYTLLSFTRGEDSTYSTQLIGFDPVASDWARFYKRGYTNLPAGEYTFRVIGRDHAGNLSQPVDFSFRIRPAPWLTWWAYLTYLLAFVGASHQLYKWRIRVVKSRQEQRIRYLNRLLESARAINSQLELEAVLQRITVEAAGLLDAEPAGIGLVQGDKVVFQKIWDGKEWRELLVAFPLRSGAAGRAAATGIAVAVNFQEASKELPLEIADLYKHGWIDVPIKARDGSIVGVLEVRGTASRPVFTAADLSLAESLAHQAAVAIENASLYGTLEERNQELQQKNLLVVESMREVEKLYAQEQTVTHALQQLNKMKSDFLILTSHEMRTPLTVIRGYTEILLDEFPDSLTEFQRNALEVCRRMADRMESILADIFEMLRINDYQVSLKPERLDIVKLAQDIVTEMRAHAERRSQTLLLESAKPLEVVADRSKLQRVFRSVLQNAIKFTRDGGRVVCSISSEDEWVRVKVTDNGIGIEPDQLDKVFEAFYTASDTSGHTSGEYDFLARGSGLGLAITRGYVLLHKGRIWIESEGKDKGATVCVQLPLDCRVDSSESKEALDQSV